MAQPAKFLPAKFQPRRRKSCRFWSTSRSKQKKTETYQTVRAADEMVDEFRALDVRTNADTPEQVDERGRLRRAGHRPLPHRHMFFEGDRIDAMREMILADNDEDRAKALEKLLPYQREDFAGIFKALKGLPATIRFLDPPLHEFLPTRHGAAAELAEKLGSRWNTSPSACASCTSSIRCLAIAVAGSALFIPEISEMQARCRFRSGGGSCRKKESKCKPEIMIPLVGFTREFELADRNCSSRRGQDCMKRKRQSSIISSAR